LSSSANEKKFGEILLSSGFNLFLLLGRQQNFHLSLSRTHTRTSQQQQKNVARKFVSHEN